MVELKLIKVNDRVLEGLKMRSRGICGRERGGFEEKWEEGVQLKEILGSLG